MPTVNMHEAKSQLSQLVEAAERGESVIIARNGKPAARLIGIKAASGRTWSEAVQKWFKEGEKLELDLSRDDLAKISEKDLF
jgi:prevent-host-death family protein